MSTTNPHRNGKHVTTGSAGTSTNVQGTQNRPQFKPGVKGEKTRQASGHGQSNTAGANKDVSKKWQANSKRFQKPPKPEPLSPDADSGKASSQTSSTSFLRSKRTAKMQVQKENGTFKKPTPNPKVKTFSPPPPFISVNQLLEEDMIRASTCNLQARNHQNPDYDGSLSCEFWTLEGMTRTSMLQQLPVTKHDQVGSMDLMGIALGEDDDEVHVGELSDVDLSQLSAAEGDNGFSAEAD